MTRVFKSVSILFVCVVLIIAGIVVFRQSLLRAGINSFLAGDAEVTRLDGVQIDPSHARIDELELRLDASGQILRVAGIDVNYSRPELFGLPVVQEVTIASASLTRSVNSVGPADNSIPGDDTEERQAPALTLSEALRQLRDFPLAKFTLTELDVPQFTQTIALHFDKQADALHLDITTGTLQLNAAFTQPDRASAAQLSMSLQADTVTVAELQLALQPQAERYELTGSGKAAFSDANTPFAEYLASPLPVSSVALQWEMAANIADALFDDPASDIRIDILQGSTFVVRPGLMAEMGEFAIAIQDKAELSVTPAAALSVTGSIPLNMTGTWQQQALQSAMVLTPTLCEPGAIPNCTIGFDGTVGMAAYTIKGTDPAAGITLDRPEFTGNGSVTIGSEFIEATLDAGARFSSAAVTAPAYSSARLDVVLDSALDLRSSVGARQLEISAEQMSLQLAALQIGEYQANLDFALRELNVVSAETITGQMTVQAPGIAVTGPQWIPAIGVDADLSIDGATLAFSTPLLLPDAPRDAQLQTSGSYDLAAGSGAIHLQLPALTLTGPDNSLTSYLSGWPFPADVMTGTLAADLDVQLQPATAVDAAGTTVITANVRVALTDMAGFYEENFFRGLNTIMEIAYDSAAPVLPVTTPPSSLTVDELNVGLPVTDIALDYQLDGDTGIMNINSISGALLDGTISGTNISYDFSSESNEMTFMFSMLSLERMMELSEYKGVEAIGAVSGEIPLIIRDGKMEIGAGTLYAEAPGGSIRYLDAPPAGQGNPAMDLVNQALSNYQFHTLESSIDYSPAGELLLGMKLRGRNPDMNGGQEINLNLNISDNIPSLLRSLRAGRAIEDFLQEQYQ